MYTRQYKPKFFAYIVSAKPQPVRLQFDVQQPSLFMMSIPRVVDMAIQQRCSQRIEKSQRRNMGLLCANKDYCSCFENVDFRGIITGIEQMRLFLTDAIIVGSVLHHKSIWHNGSKHTASLKQCKAHVESFNTLTLSFLCGP